MLSPPPGQPLRRLLDRSERVQRGKQGPNNRAESAEWANGQGSARVAGFGEDGADHLIGAATVAGDSDRRSRKAR